MKRKKYMVVVGMNLWLLACSATPGHRRGRPRPQAGDRPVCSQVMAPIGNETFNKKGTARVRKQGENPRIENGLLVFDGNRQVDPQIALGNRHVLPGTNSGLVI